MTFRISRRSFLRGIGGVAVGLPALELMEGTARAAEPPRRFVMSYGGISTGADASSDDLLTPSTTGRGYEIRPALAPLSELDITDDVSVVTGLRIPYEENGEMPPGGRTVQYHYNTAGPQIAGTYAGNRGETGDAGINGEPRGPSADQIVADAIAGDTVQRLIAYRVQPNSYVGSNEVISWNSGRLSWRQHPDGTLESIDPCCSPRLAYESLFASFSPEDPAEAARTQAMLRRRLSVLDLVRGSAARLLPRLGAADRIRLERHFDEIRGIENRLQYVPPPSDTCRQLAHPGDDPPLGGAIIEYNGAGQPYSTSEGYSDEDHRADVMTDLIAMAFACDLTRVASFMLTEWKCYMNVFPLSDAGWQSDMHQATHDPNQYAVTDAVAWHVRQWGKLVRKLKDTPDANGTSVLDHSALILLFEGGWGYDPEHFVLNSAHSTENMSVLIAGRAGGLASGQHVSAPGAHPASVVITGMEAMGVEGGLGEIYEDVPALFTT